MSMRVASFAASNSLMQQAMRIQAQETTVTAQEASGLKSTTYGDLGASSGKLVSLQASITRSKAYSAAATGADARVQQMYSSVGKMIDTLTSFKTDLASFDETSASTDNTTLISNAKSTLSSLVAEMNTTYAGNYVFAGSAVDTKPVDVSAMTAQTDPTTADTSYYKGDDTVASVKVGDDTTVSYGVTADNAAFEAGIRALNTISAGKTDTASITSASNLVDSAMTGLTTIQSQLSLNSKALESAVTDQSDYQSFVSSSVTDLDSVDVAQAASDLSNYTTQLQAAYSAIGKIQSLSLASYLK
jgi:flagellar hook-associated protein 3 FlgL